VLSADGEHRHRSQHDRVQYIANVVTVISGLCSLIALFSGQLLWVLPAVAALVFTGYSLKNHRWKPAAFGLAVVMFALAIGASSYLQPAGQGAPGTHPVVLGATSSAKAPAEADASASPASAVPRTLSDSEVRLVRYAAVDVDQAHPQALPNQVGADGSLDLYFDPSDGPSIVAHDAEAVLTPSEGTTDPYGSCTDQFDDTMGDHDFNPSGSLSLGSGFCFKTSADRMAYAVVVAVEPPVPTGTPLAVTLHVTVWDVVLP
jgi:hypothetical protein